MAPIFFYRARNGRGRLVSGHIEADSRGAAVALLRRRGLFVVELRPVPAAGRGREGAGGLLGRRVSVKALALFCRQFATMSEAGIPLLQCLHILVQQTEHKTLRTVLQEVLAGVERGTALSEAFARFRGRIPELVVNMVAAGEVAGTLDQALHRLAVHFEKEHDLREKIKSAMTYPVLVAGVSVVAMIVLLVVIVPVFTDIFNQMGATLPLPTRVLIGVSNFVKRAWFVLPALAAALFVGFRALARTPRGREFVDRLVLRLPIAGPLIHKTILARFARTLATLLRGGVPLLQSLQTVERV
ncbi:MAG: type II secretion system F family protein, partial [Firmicutes bacterium]|nr:type II secretion system F family protein [Bacillota bacterium]